MGASKEHIAWLKSLPEYKHMVAVMGEYDDSKDYVGAEGDWKSKYIPRKIMGVDINICAYIHDYWYLIGGDTNDRFDADAGFLVDLLKTICFSPKKWFWGTDWIRKATSYSLALKYFEAVRVGGKKAFTYVQ